MSGIPIGCLAALLIDCLFTPIALAAADTASVQVETVALQHQELPITLTSYGTVAPTEESIFNVSFSHPGQITGFYVRVGQKVTTGDRLATITADPATRQGYAQATVALEFAKRELERQQRLRAQHFATNAQVATAQKAVMDATVALESERKLGDDQPTQVATAPFTGYVAQLMAAPGDRLPANTTIMRLVRTDQDVGIAVGLKPEDADGIAPGMPAEITPILSAPAHSIKGTVRQISGMVNPATKLIDAWIDVTNPISLLPGTSVSAVITISQHEGWVVPRNGVLQDDKGSYIFQVMNGHAKRVNVTTGVETDQLTEIYGEFDPLLPVVSLGNYELQDGMAVRETLLAATNP